MWTEILTPNHSDSRRSIAPIGVFLGFLIFFALLADRTGYEGDDLNSVLPMLHLDAARDGLIEIYRYDWQPLSYQIGAALVRLAQSPLPAFLLPAFAMALAMSLQFSLLKERFGVPVPIFLCIVMLSPEFLYSGLYYNTVALGYCAATAALVVTLWGKSTLAAVGVGVLMAASALLRLDFLLIIPAMLLVGVLRSGGLRLPLVSGCVAGAILLTALGTGFVRFPELIAIYEFHSMEMAEMADTGGWNNLAKAFVASTILSPLGFLVYGAGSFWLLRVLTRREVLSGLLVTASLFPALMALPNILSVKYMLPSYVFLPLLGGRIWHELHARKGQNAVWFDRGLITATLMLSFAAVDVDNQRPYLQIKLWETRQIGTHDGRRSWGAYLPQMLRVERLSEPGEFERAGRALADHVRRGGDPVTVFVGEDDVFVPGGIGWRHAALELAYDGDFGTVGGKGIKQIETRGGELWLVTKDTAIPSETANNPSARLFKAEDPDLIIGLTKSGAEVQDGGS